MMRAYLAILRRDLMLAVRIGGSGVWASCSS